MFLFLFAYLFQYEVSAIINIVDKGVVPLEIYSVGIQFFIDLENEDRAESCKVHTWTKKCCLTDSEKEDCHIMHVYTADTEVKPRDKETLIYVYPTLFQHDQMGFCDFFLSYKCGRNSRNRRELVNIPFDTRVPTNKRVAEVLKTYIGGRNRVKCSFLDEDSLNDCMPVNCDEKYSEARPYYDSNLSKCVEVVKCIGSTNKDLPDIVLVPRSNVCRNLDKPLMMEDILEISRGLLTTTEPPNMETEMKLELISNCSTISQNLYFLRDLMLGKFCPMQNVDTSEYNKCFKMAVIKIIAGIMAVSLMLLACIFCLNIMTWLNSKCQDGSLQSTWEDFKYKFKKVDMTKKPFCKYKVSRVNTDVRNSLLKQVIVRDIPMELRDSVVDICDRMERDVRWKRRYRKEDMGSQVSFAVDASDNSDSSLMSEDDESTRLIK